MPFEILGLACVESVPGPCERSAVSRASEDSGRALAPIFRARPESSLARDTALRSRTGTLATQTVLALKLFEIILFYFLISLVFIGD